MLRAAQQAGLPVVADHFCNVTNTQTAAALQDLGAEGAVLSLECSAREVARLASRWHHDMPLAVCVHGRLPSMLTRQEHAVATKGPRRMQAATHDGGLPYVIEQRTAGMTTIWEGRMLCAPEEAAKTAGIIDAWVLELGGCAADEVATLCSHYQALAQGGGDPEAIRSVTLAAHSDGIFPGHLATGSRALDAVRADSSD